MLFVCEICTVNSQYNGFFGTAEKKTYQKFILKVGLHIDMYTVYRMLNRSRN